VGVQFGAQLGVDVGVLVGRGVEVFTDVGVRVGVGEPITRFVKMTSVTPPPILTVTIPCEVVRLTRLLSGLTSITET
jgi:hypothetical protein